MPNLLRRALLAGLPLLALPARAQTTADIDQRDAAMVEAWDKTPLTIRHALFTTQKATGVGMYDPRPSPTFKSGEPLIAYAEPIGYGWKPVDGGLFEFGFDVDFLLKTPDGTVLAGKENFGHLVQRSRLKNREFMVTLTLDVTGASPGDYILQYKLRDITGPKSASFDLPFTIAA